MSALRARWTSQIGMKTGPARVFVGGRPPLLVLVSCFVALVVSTLSSCGVPVDRQPTALSRSGVPFDLLAPSSPSTTSTTFASQVSAEIFLLNSASLTLVAVPRAVPATEDNLATVLGVLVDGPTVQEANGGLQSAIPPQTTVLGASIAPGGLATVNLGGSFGQLVGQLQIEAVAQIVFTVSSLPGQTVTGVTFQLQGQPIEVPNASGAQVPVASRAEYQQLAP